MRSAVFRAESELPSHLAGTLLRRGLSRMVWTTALLALFFVAGRSFQEALGHISYALIAPIALVLAWMWGRFVGALTGVLGAWVNALWALDSGLIDSVSVSVAVDAVAIGVVAFLFGHLGATLESALGTSARTRRAYTKLEASARERMLTITDQVPVGLYRTTAEGEIVGGNDAMMKILGFTDREALHQADVWEHYVRTEDRSRQLEAPADDDGAWREFELRQADGTRIWVRDWSRAVRDPLGEVVHFDGVLVDITEERIAAERFRAAFEDSPIGVTISSVDGRIMKANAAAAELLGQPLEQVVGMHFSEYTFDDDLATTTSALEDLAAGQVVRYEKRIKRSDDSVIWVLISLAPIHDGDEAPSHFISHVVDITDRRRAQDALENLVRFKDDLIASVSHELRTPLTVVQGLAHELDASWLSFSVPEQKEFIGLIAQQSSEVAAIVEDLLVAARADIGKLPISPTAVDLRVAGEEALGSTPSLGIAVGMVGDQPPMAFADPSRVRQILRNLLSNAQRYGGPAISMRCGGNGAIAWIEVADDGDGIPEGESDLVFEPYGRAHNAVGQPSSVGLGLSVSRRLADLMGGTLRYRRESDLTVFRLELPTPGSVHATSRGAARLA